MAGDMKLKSAWKMLKSQISTAHESKPISSYDIVSVLMDSDCKPKLMGTEEEVASYFVFTNEQSARGFTPENPMKKMMLGTLCEQLRQKEEKSYIKVNPRFSDRGYVAENILFCPAYDSVTQKSLLTDPDDAKALLAIAPDDQKRLGIEMTFFMLTSRSIPDQVEDRQNYLKEKIEELSFVAPRVPMKKGSGTFLVVILNLDNELEEQAFIREYKMFDEYSDVLFVTSSLRLLTGSLEEIHYNGDEIDTVFLPMIKWQRKA